MSHTTPHARAADEPRRVPRSLRALGGLGVVAVAVMAFAPQVGALDPRGGFTDAILPGTDGTAHYQSPETDRAVDVQLLALDRTVAAGHDVVAVRLRLASLRGSDIAGCTVQLVSQTGDVLPGEPVAGSACGAGGRGNGPQELESTVRLRVPAGVRVGGVRVMWSPPAYVALPAV